MWTYILLAIGWLIAALMTFVAYRFYRKAVVYDEVFSYLSDDIITNIRQFVKMQRMDVMSGEPEIQQAHRNMVIMGRRLEEILRRMEEASGLSLRPPPSPPRPRVID